MRDKTLRTTDMICRNSSPFPHPPSNVVVCAGLYTLPCLKRVCSFQHCLEGGGEDHSQYPRGERSAYFATSEYLKGIGCERKFLRNRSKDFCPPLSEEYSRCSI